MNTPSTPREPASDRNEDGFQIDSIPVQLTFSIGEKTVELGELAKIQSGYIFELDYSPNAQVRIEANGKPIAWGEIVECGDRLGVRVLEIEA